MTASTNGSDFGSSLSIHMVQTRSTMLVPVSHQVPTRMIPRLPLPSKPNDSSIQVKRDSRAFYVTLDKWLK